MRWRLDLAYDGTDFHGWARQGELRTVQGLLAAALRTALGRDGEVGLVAAGRTDAGVHARGQVAHVDIDPIELDRMSIPRDDPDTLRRRLTGLLPEDIVVRSVTGVSADFDARFSALSRHYRYRIADSPLVRDPLRRRDTVDHPRRLDLAAMNLAAAALVGEHDFASFCRPRPGASTIRRVLECAWSRDEEGRAVLDVAADAFCHSMVRALVGALVAVGSGRRDPSWVVEILDSRRRGPGVPVMPARGLTLEEVRYPQAGEWSARQRTTRAVRSAPL